MLVVLVEERDDRRDVGNGPPAAPADPPGRVSFERGFSGVCWVGVIYVFYVFVREMMMD